MGMNIRTEHALATTVKENKEEYTTRYVVKSTVARKLRNAIGS